MIDKYELSRMYLNFFTVKFNWIHEIIGFADQTYIFSINYVHYFWCLCVWTGNIPVQGLS